MRDLFIYFAQSDGLWHSSHDQSLTHSTMPTHCVMQHWPPSDAHPAWVTAPPTSSPPSLTDWVCMMDYTMDYGGLCDWHSHRNNKNRSALRGDVTPLWFCGLSVGVEAQFSCFFTCLTQVDFSLVLWWKQQAVGNVTFSLFCEGCSPRVAMATVYSPPVFFPSGKSSSFVFVSWFWAEFSLLNNPVGLERI